VVQNRLSIRHWQDALDGKGVAVVFDIFRCSTTIHCLKHRGSDPLWIAPNLPSLVDANFRQNLSIFSELKTDISCLARFDNSPKLALENGRPSQPALVATTTGTPAMFAARIYRQVYVGSLVSFSALIKELSTLNEPITLIPAAFKDAGHVEDQITAEAVAAALDGFSNMPDFINGCANRAVELIKASGRPDLLAGKIVSGLEDVTVAMDVDRFGLVSKVNFVSETLGKVI
jgi:phosphosulfolactate phosphohydrolase-like enzyme